MHLDQPALPDDVATARDGFLDALHDAVDPLADLLAHMRAWALRNRGLASGTPRDGLRRLLSDGFDASLTADDADDLDAAARLITRAVEGTIGPLPEPGTTAPGHDDDLDELVDELLMISGTVTMALHVLFDQVEAGDRPGDVSIHDELRRLLRTALQRTLGDAGREALGTTSLILGIARRTAAADLDLEPAR